MAKLLESSVALEPEHELGVKTSDTHHTALPGPQRRHEPSTSKNHDEKLWPQETLTRRDDHNPLHGSHEVFLGLLQEKHNAETLQ